jgi:hypothetical protein
MLLYRFAKLMDRLERKEAAMEDFPIWLKLLVWIIAGGAFIYMILAIYFGGLPA